MNILISLYDYTGNASRPYDENGWKVYRIDIQNGIDILKWDFGIPLRENNYKEIEKIGIIAMQPCTAYALSGNRHKKQRLLDGSFAYSQKLVARTCMIITYYNMTSFLSFWQLEQPMTDIHKHNPWIGSVKQKFNPCDFAGYDPIPNNSRYNKQPCLFGEFTPMIKRRLEPLEKSSPVWIKYGGKSLATKNARSATPLGFAYAFYNANH